MTRALVFYPSNARTVALETMMLALHHQGIEMELLTTCEAGPLHAYLRGEGIPTHAHPVASRLRIFEFVQQAVNLVRFCRRHRTDVVLSHLQQANIISVFARFVLSARVLTFRHHFDFVFPGDQVSFPRDRTEALFDRIITRLSTVVIVPSEAVADGMRRLERVGRTQLRVVPYVYDFDKCDSPNETAVEAIRTGHPAKLTLVMVSRLVPLKRPDLALAAMRELITEGLDVRLLVLGDGPQRAALEAFVASHQLGDRIVMLGHRGDVVNYMAAGDLLLHPSLTEASSNAVKEMALLGKPAIVCEGVGDFDDYVQDGRNGFTISRNASAQELAATIRRAYDAQDQLTVLGTALRDQVQERFGVSAARIGDYLALLSQG